MDVDLLARDKQLEELSSLIARQSAGTAVVISGPPGVGKSQLAIHWAHTHAEDFPDGELFVDLHGYSGERPPMQVGETASMLLAFLGVPAQAIPEDSMQRAALFRELMSVRRTVLVLDNARESRQVIPLIPTGSSAVIITSRAVLEFARSHGLAAIDLKPLSTGESVDFLRRRIGHERCASDAAVLPHLAATCSGLPIALTLLSARFSVDPHLTPSEVVSQLESHGARLDLLDSGESDANVRTLFSWSLSAITKQALEAFIAIGALGLSTFDAMSIAAFLQLRPAFASQALRELHRASLVTRTNANRYGIHDLLLDFARESCEARYDDDGLVEHYKNYLQYLSTEAYANERILYPLREDVPADLRPRGALPGHGRSYRDAYEWFTEHIEEIRLALGKGQEARLNAEGWLLSWSVTTFLDRSGLWDVYVETQARGVGMAPPGRARPLTMSLRLLATALLRSDRRDEAEERLAEALAVPNQGEASHARTLLALSLHYDSIPDYPRALKYANDAYREYRDADIEAGVWRSLSFVAWFRAHADPRNVELAAMEVEEAIHGLIRLDNAWELGHAHYHRGYIQLRQSKPADAFASYRTSADYFARLEATYFTGRSLLEAARTAMDYSLSEDVSMDLRTAKSYLAPFGGDLLSEVLARLDSLNRREPDVDQA